MLKIEKRKVNPKEVEAIQAGELKWSEKAERFSVLFIGTTFCLLLPFLWYDKRYPVDSHTEGLIMIPLLIISILISLLIYRWIDRTEGTPNTPIKNVAVEVFTVQTDCAIQREDPEDFGIAFYLSVHYEGKQQWLFLWGQYLDELCYEKAFPNTSFELVRRVDNGAFLDIKLKGKYFEPEKIVPAFSRAVWKSDTHEVDGDILDKSKDEIT